MAAVRAKFVVVEQTSPATKFVVGREFFVDFIDPNAGTTEHLESQAQSVVLSGFKFALGQRVSIKESQESGEIRSRSEGLNCEPQYYVSYRAADGRAVMVWWEESLLKAI